MFNPSVRGRSGLRPRQVRPALEALERRDCPSSFGTQPGQQLWYLLNTSPVTHSGVHASSGSVSNSSELGGGGAGGGIGVPSGPTVSLNVTYNSRISVTIYGTVTDTSSSPAGLLVLIAGQAIGVATTDANGNFSLTTNAIGLGNVRAWTVDGLDICSPTATLTLTAPPPVITNFAATEGSGQLFTFSGTVTDQNPGGLTITFGGIPSLSGQTATVNSNGSFSLTIQLNSNGSDNGLALAQTTDWWGLQSNLASTYVNVTS